MVFLPTVVPPVLYEFLRLNVLPLLTKGGNVEVGLCTGHLKFVMEYLRTLEKQWFLGFLRCPVGGLLSITVGFLGVWCPVVVIPLVSVRVFG